jgi:hypothetical protein
MTMRSTIFKCPPWMIILLVAGGLAPLALLGLVRAEGWPSVTAWILVGVAVFILVYALLLLPTRLVVSDEGIWQQLVFSEWRLRWGEIVEWRHCDGGAEFEQGAFREQTKGKWHFIEFWVRDKTGRKHYLKRWLVFGKRSRQIAEIMRERGIAGG